MIEIRLDNETVTFSSDVTDAFVATFDYLLGRDERTLAPLYKKYKDHDFEDLVEELCDLASERDLEPEVVFHVSPRQNIKFSQEVLRIG